MRLSTNIYENILTSFLKEAKDYCLARDQLAALTLRIQRDRRRKPLIADMKHIGDLIDDVQLLEMSVGCVRTNELYGTVRIVKGIVDRVRMRQDNILKAYLRLVPKLARHAAESEVEALDFFQSGSLGLATAISRYNVRKGAHFHTFAQVWIRQRILGSRKHSSPIIRLPNSVLENYQKIRAAERRLQEVAATRDTYTDADLAEESGLSIRSIKNVRQKMQQAHVVHLSTVTPDGESGYDFIPSGTVVVRIGQNDESVHEAVRTLADRFGLRVTTVATGLADPGPFPSLGSADVLPVRKSEIAILAEDGIQGYSFGYAWHTLDRQYQIPTTVLRTRSVSGTPIDRFDVIVIPAASGLPAALDSAGVDRIRRWVRDGGTLITIGSGTEFARDSTAIGIHLGSWYETDAGENARAFDVPGAIVRVELDPEYWLAAGYRETTFPALVNGARLYVPPEGPPSADRRVVGRYVPRDSLLISGHVWDESLDRLPGKVFLYEERVGAGRVIAFAEEVNWRSYWRGANRLFLNAVVIGPSAQ